jgi:hypothetical protein
LNSKDINDDLKLRFKHIINNKGEIDFYDVYDLAYLQKKTQHTNEPNANTSLASTSIPR